MQWLLSAVKCGPLRVATFGASTAAAVAGEMEGEDRHLAEAIVAQAEVITMILWN